MSAATTVLIGQVLQIRDKMIAKRHVIPADLKSEWRQLMHKTELFDGSHDGHRTLGKHQSMTKKSGFSGSANELKGLVNELQALDLKVKHH